MLVPFEKVRIDQAIQSFKINTQPNAFELTCLNSAEQHMTHVELSEGIPLYSRVMTHPSVTYHRDTGFDHHIFIISLSDSNFLVTAISTGEILYKFDDKYLVF